MRDEPDNDVDAVYPVDLRVAAHSSATIVFVIGWRESGCNERGHTSFDMWPTVRFQLLRRDHEVTPNQLLILRTYSEDDPNRPGC